MDGFTMIKKLGQGGQGSVILVKRKVEPVVAAPQPALQQNQENSSSSIAPASSPPEQYFALKKIRCSDLQELNSALREAQSVLQLKHPFIVNCIEFFIDRPRENSRQVVASQQDNVCIIYEYCEKGNLGQVIDKARIKGIKLPARVRLSAEFLISLF